MRCASCQAENPPLNKFCGECGQRLPAGCPSCGHPSQPGPKFCGECGASLAGGGAASGPRVYAPATVAGPDAALAPPSSAFREAAPVTYTPKHLADKILTSKSAIEGERKTVTVMFSDVSGFTAMSERLDPEDVHAMMDRAFEVILEAVHRHEGTINQFLGDGVMALFGAPIAHEDHAQRALSAALAIQVGLLPLAEEIKRAHGVEFRMRMGINTGPVVVGAIGRDLRMDYTAVGDTTNLAARLLALAGPGQVVVSQRTQSLRDRFFAFQDLGEFQVKGKSEPVRAYALTGETRGRVRGEVTRDRVLTPMVGRTRQLGHLRAAFERAVDGQGRPVVIVGEPGMGKSRVLYEFLHGLEEETQTELETTCASYGPSIAYRPIAELLRAYLAVADTTTAREIRLRIDERLGELGLPGEERALLLAHFIGLSAPPELLNRLSSAELKERTFAALRDVFLRVSDAGPLVLVIENVHWIDVSSAEFLAHLIAGAPGHPLFLVMSMRPPVLPWLDALRAEAVAVAGLDIGEIREMACTLLAVDDVADDLFAILVEKGDGNPLYVEEILHQLRETGGLVLEGGQARLGQADVKVPATIQDIIAARVDRLADRLKLTLQGAAVVGRRFGVTLLSRVIDVPADAVQRQLEDLHRFDFVFPSADDPERMYSFKHALTQDVVYAALLDRRRRAYHVAAARGLEALYVDRIDEMVEILAHHFGASGEHDPAVDYALLAAEKAQRRWANTEALAYFDGALGRLQSMPDTPANRLRRIDAVIKQAEVKFALGRHAEHVEALEGIRELVESTADPRRRASWCYWTGFLRSLVGGRPDVPIAYCREAEAIADAEGYEDIRAFAECCLAHVLMSAGQLAEALDAGERALATFEARGNTWWACRALWALIPVANGLGDWERGLEYGRRAVEHGLAVNDLRLKVVGWWRTGSVHIHRGEPDTGLRWCEEALALSPIAFDAAMIRGVHGYGLLKASQIEAGAAELASTVTWLERSQLHYTRSIFALFLAEAQLCQGERLGARATLEPVRETARDNGYRHLEGVAERLLAETFEPGDPPGAAHVDAAMGICEEVGARNDLAKALVSRAAHCWTAGDLASARTALERALATFEALGTVDGRAVATALLEVLTARAAAGAPRGHVLVVARERLYLHATLSRALSASRDVTVVLDRRTSMPAANGGGPDPDRRRPPSRTHAAELELVGYAVAPAGV